MRLSSMADYAVVTMAAAARHCGSAQLVGPDGKRAARANATQLAGETGRPAPTVRKAGRRVAGLVHGVSGGGGARERFAMSGEYVPATSIRKMLSGTANVLGIVAVEEGVKLIAEAGIDAVRAKSLALTDFEIALVDQWGLESSDSLVTPRDHAVRGGHVTIRTPNARAITDHLIANGIVPDFRNPDMIRLGLSPLTT